MHMGPPPSSTPTIYDSYDCLVGAFADVRLPRNKETDVLGSYISCGISMLSGLSSSPPRQIVNKILTQRATGDRKKIKEAFVLFSDTAHSKGGNDLYRYIVENEIGNIMEFGPRKNPNTGNMIKLWVWAPPHESLEVDDRFMPVYGKILVRAASGVFYKDDPRFENNLNTSEM